MGLRMRKSISLGGGARLNLGKKGASVSFGTKGLRHSIHTSGRRTTTVGIPGTGISYVSSSSSRNNSRTSNRNYRSAAYERRQRIQEQKNIDKENEIKQNKLLLEEYETMVQLIKSLHMECDDYIDWNHIHTTPAPYEQGTIGPRQHEAQNKRNLYKPNIIEKLFKSLYNKKILSLENFIEIAKKEDKNDYEEWLALFRLSERILSADLDSYLQVIEEMNPLDDLLEFGSDFEFGLESPSLLEVEFKVKSKTVVPDYSLSLTKTGKISRKNLTKSNYYDLIQDYVCSCTLRIARDMFALLPIDTIVIHAVDDILQTDTGHTEEVTILSVEIDRSTLNSLNFECLDPSDSMSNFTYNMKFLKTSGFKSVKRIND